MVEQKPDSLAKVAAKPTKITLGGQEYLVSPINLDDLAEFEAHIRNKRVVGFLRSAAQVDLPVQEKMEIVASIQAKAISGEDLTDEMGSMDGVCFIQWRMLVRNQRNLGLKKVSRMISLDNLEEVSGIIAGFGGIGGLEEDEEKGDD